MSRLMLEDAMETLVVTTEEARLLQMIAQARRAGLVPEIGRTAHREFRELLQHQAELLDSIVAKLDATLAGRSESTGYHVSRP